MTITCDTVLGIVSDTESHEENILIVLQGKDYIYIYIETTGKNPEKFPNFHSK